MSDLLALWLPILLSAVALFIASAMAWTVLPHHKPDWKQLPQEDGLLTHIRSNSIAPGQYIFPYCEPKDMKDPAVMARYKAGPHGTINIWPGMCSMGRNMTLTFLFFVLSSIFVGYITSLWIANATDATYLQVFQVSGTAAVMAYCLAFIPNAVWFGKPGRAVLMDVIDGVAYGLITAGIFGWLAV